MGLQIVLASSRKKSIFKEGDPEFEYGRRYHHFGIYDPVGVIPARPDKLFARWLKMVNYCKREGFTPVAVFAVDNPSLSSLCQKLGMLTVGISRDSLPSSYNKVVMDEDLFYEAGTVYYFKLPGDDVELPEPVKRAEDKEAQIIEIPAAAQPDLGAKDMRRVSPDKVLRDQPKIPSRIPKDPYAEFPLDDLMEQFVQKTDDSSMPLELPEGLHDFTKL